MRIFLLISFICSLAYALTTTPGWNAGNVVLNSIQGTAGNLPITSTAGNPINIIPGATPAWNFNSTGHFVPNTNATVDIGTSALGVKDQYLSTGSVIYKGTNKFIHSPGTDSFYSGAGAGSVSTGSNNFCGGAFACTSNTTGSGNAYGGAYSGLFAVTADNNTGWGTNTLRNLSTATRDTAVGKDAAVNITTQSDITAIGYQSGRSVGAGTTTVGSSAALNSNSSCIGATITGFGAGGICRTTGLAIYGKDAGAVNSSSATDNSYFGDSSGLVNDSGNSNSCFGKGSCSTTVSGNRIIMMGKNINATSASASDELGIGTWIRGNATTLDLKAFGVIGLSMDTSGNVFTPSSKFNLNANGNITSINNVPMSWPASQGAASTFLQNDGTGALSWVAGGGGGGVTTMTAVGAAPNANGATITGANLTLQPADATHPGVVINGAQTFGGSKNFTGPVTQVKKLAIVESGTTFTPLHQMDVATDLAAAPAAYTIGCVADVAGSLNNRYFYISAIGLAGDELFRDYYFWINVSGTGTDPAPRAGTGVEVPINTNDIANDVAIAVSAALGSTGTLNPVSTIANVISITASRNGAPQLNASTETSTFGVTTTAPGVGQIYSQYSGVGEHATSDGTIVGSQPSPDGGTVIFNRTKNIILSTYPGGGFLVSDAPLLVNRVANVQTRDPAATVEYDLTNAAGSASGAINLIPSGVLGVSGNGGVAIGGVGFPVNINDSVFVNNGDISLTGIGNGLKIAEGANARQDTCTLIAGTCTIPNSTILANTRIYCHGQDDNGGVPGFLRVSTRTVGTDYTVTSGSVADTSIVACLLVGAL